MKKISKMHGTGWGRWQSAMQVGGDGGWIRGYSEGGNKYTDSGATEEVKSSGAGAG